MAQLSQKELMYLQDQLNIEQLEIEKFGSAAAQVNDPALREMFLSIQKTHQRHFDLLMRHLGAGTIM